MDNVEKAYRQNNSQVVQDDGDIVNEADTIDETINARKTVTEMQYAIHSGKAFSVANNGSIAAATKKYFLIKTGSHQVHFMTSEFEFETGNFVCSLTEDPITTADGTLLPSANMNRVRPMNLPLTSVYGDPSVTSVGTDMGATTKVMPTSKAPSSTAISNGRVLDPNRNYLLTLDNLNSTGTHLYSYSLTYHEA